MSDQQTNEQPQQDSQKDNSEKTTRDEFEKDLEELESKNKEYLEGWKRAKADYLNLKKESEKKYYDLIKFANEGLIMEILPVFDNFKLAAVHIPEEQKKSDWVVGIMHIKKQLEDILKNLGIEEIKTVGEKFNPELHEAVEDSSKFKVQSSKLGEDVEEKKEGNKKKLEIGKPVPSLSRDWKLEGEEGKGKEERDGIITKEVRSGYMLHGKVIQPARVIVG